MVYYAHKKYGNFKYTLECHFFELTQFYVGLSFYSDNRYHVLNMYLPEHHQTHFLQKYTQNKLIVNSRPDG